MERAEGQVSFALCAPEVVLPNPNPSPSHNPNPHPNRHPHPHPHPHLTPQQAEAVLRVRLPPAYPAQAALLELSCPGAAAAALELACTGGLRLTLLPNPVPNPTPNRKG